MNQPVKTLITKFCCPSDPGKDGFKKFENKKAYRHSGRRAERPVHV